MEAQMAETAENSTPLPPVELVRDDAAPHRGAPPRWLITTASLVVVLVLWEIFGRRVNPVFGSYPSAIAVAFWDLTISGELERALIQSLQPFCVGFGLAILVGVPLGLVIGRFRAVEAAIGIYVTAGYSMPLVALVPLLMLWLGLGFKVKAAVVMLMSLFPVCINTWRGVAAVPKSLIDVGKSLVAPDHVILRRIVLPATLPYVMAGIRLSVGRAVVAMIIAEFFTAISGLGAIILNSANNFDTARMFVPVVVLIVLATGLNALIGAIERWVAPWQAEIAGRNN
jgi:NitT/TauT family transport system permease protein